LKGYTGEESDEIVSHLMELLYRLGEGGQTILREKCPKGWKMLEKIQDRHRNGQVKVASHRNQ
jgi:hypothetical protein